MERLTKRVGCSAVPTKFVHKFILRMDDETFQKYQALLDRLADYEDTGLTPDEITTMANDIETRFLRYIEKTYGQDAGELLRIWEAAKDGRVAILPAPAKEGDPKPECFYNDNWTSMWCQGMAHTDGDEPTERCKNCWYCEHGYAAEEGRA